MILYVMKMTLIEIKIIIKKIIKNFFEENIDKIKEALDSMQNSC